MKIRVWEILLDDNQYAGCVQAGSLKEAKKIVADHMIKAGVSSLWLWNPNKARRYRVLNAIA